MKSRMLVVLMFVSAMCLSFVGSAHAGALVAQPNSPIFSGDGKPEDWESPRSEGYTVYGRPTDWESLYHSAGHPEDWGFPQLQPSDLDSPTLRAYGSTADWGKYGSQGRPEDWGESSRSVWSNEGKPEDWDGPIPLFIISIFRIFYLR